MFEIRTYSYAGPRNKISKKLTNEKIYTCQANDVLDIKSPVVKILTNDDLSFVPIAYIPNFSRYYFITHREILPNGLWILHLDEDLLMTYREHLQTCKAAFNRSSDYYNMYLPDSYAPITQRQIVTNKIFPDTPFDNDIASHGAIVTIAGASQ